jgi:hypothetical protein
MISAMTTTSPDHDHDDLSCLIMISAMTTTMTMNLASLDNLEAFRFSLDSSVPEF